MSPHQPLDTALVLRLELVVKLVPDALTHLHGERLGVEPRGQPLDERHEQHRVAQVRLDRFCHPGVLDLHGHVIAVDGGGAMDLANRGRGKRTLVEVREHTLKRPAELPPHQLLQVRERHRRDVVPQRGEPVLQFVALVLGKAVELDHRHHLADLHRRAAHLPKLVDELLHGCCGPLTLGGGGPLGRSHPIRGPHPGPAQALPRHQPADARRPRKPPGGQLSRFRRRIVGLRAHRPSLASRPHPSDSERCRPGRAAVHEARDKSSSLEPRRADVGGRTPRLLLRFAGHPEGFAVPFTRREKRLRDQ
jgi:hypothetical protein